MLVCPILHTKEIPQGPSGTIVALRLLRQPEACPQLQECWGCILAKPCCKTSIEFWFLRNLFSKRTINRFIELEGPHEFNPVYCRPCLQGMPFKDMSMHAQMEPQQNSRVAGWGFLVLLLWLCSLTPTQWDTGSARTS